MPATYFDPGRCRFKGFHFGFQLQSTAAYPRLAGMLALNYFGFRTINKLSIYHIHSQFVLVSFRNEIQKRASEGTSC
jgi:hypothetical protein